MVERGAHALNLAAVVGPAIGDRDEADRQAGDRAVADQLEDLVAEAGLADLPDAVQSVWFVAQFDADPDRQGAGVAWVGGGERGGRVVGERAGPEGFQLAADPDLDTVGDGDADDLPLVLADSSSAS